jgi:hypothetical protein
VTDPEDVTGPTRAELEEAVVDETPDSQRPQPIEADPADVAEQRADLGPDDDDRIGDEDEKY